MERKIRLVESDAKHISYMLLISFGDKCSYKYYLPNLDSEKAKEAAETIGKNNGLEVVIGE